MPADDVSLPWQRAKEIRKSQRQEKDFSKRSDVRPQVNSGRIPLSRRDNQLISFIGRFLIDNKTLENPENQSYTIKKKDWLALKHDAEITPPRCLPALQIDIQEVHLLVMELETWDDVTKYVLELEARLEDALSPVPE